VCVSACITFASISSRRFSRRAAAFFRARAHTRRMVLSTNSSAEIVGALVSRTPSPSPLPPCAFGHVGCFAGFDSCVVLDVGEDDGFGVVLGDAFGVVLGVLSLSLSVSLSLSACVRLSASFLVALCVLVGISDAFLSFASSPATVAPPPLSFSSSPFSCKHADWEPPVLLNVGVLLRLSSKAWDAADRRLIGDLCAHACGLAFPCGGVRRFRPLVPAIGAFRLSRRSPCPATLLSGTVLSAAAPNATAGGTHTQGDLEPTPDNPPLLHDTAREPRGRTVTGEIMMPSPSPLSVQWRSMVFAPCPTMLGSRPSWSAAIATRVPSSHWRPATCGACTASQPVSARTHDCGGDGRPDVDIGLRGLSTAAGFNRSCTTAMRVRTGLGLAVLLSLSAPPSYARQPPATCGALPAAPHSGELRGAAAAPKTAAHASAEMLSVSPSCESRAQELPVRCVILDFDSTISAPQYLERFGKWAIADKAEILEVQCLSLISY
jgi:hypothetical protein